MSCPEEDRLLQQDDYRKKLAYQIASGIIGYLSLNTNFNNFANAVY
jgi:N-acetylmuramoyl-L-alanine amidase